MAESFGAKLRVPPVDPKRDKEIARLRKLLADLERTPTHRREFELADEREISIKAMLRELEPPIYQWTTDDEEIAIDAIMVRIGGPSSQMIELRLSYAEPLGSIYWDARVTPKGVFNSGGETGWWTVKDALTHAHALQHRMGYDRVLVTIAEAGIWRPEWGRLADKEAF